MENNENSRRSFIKKLSGSAAGLAITNDIFAKKVHILKSSVKVNSADEVRIGLIGCGIIGHYDAPTAMKIPGVKLVAACDLYQGRLDRAKEKWGADLFTTRDYRELLARKDIDAVLICVPDFWHDHISIAAMEAGKHVYCEKPMIHHVEEGHAVIAAQKKTGKVFQVGSQRASSVGLLEAKKYYEQGVIGNITVVETFNDRTNAIGAWQYSIPTDASAAEVNWDKYLGDAPKRPYEAPRYFRWRNYKDYGTGVAGDLFVHLITGLHMITGAIGPNKIFAFGNLAYWKDGRDAYDVMNAVMQYPKTDKHEAFQFTTRVNFSDGGGGGESTKIVGTDGVIEVKGNNISIKRLKRSTAPGYGGYDSFESFSAKQKEDFKKWYEATYGGTSPSTKFEEPIEFKAPAGYDDRYDHMVTFFNAVRANNPSMILEDATFGLRAAGPSLLCNMSAELQKPILWNPKTMKIVK